jgi:hypothetical protein
MFIEYWGKMMQKSVVNKFDNKKKLYNFPINFSRRKVLTNPTFVYDFFTSGISKNIMLFLPNIKNRFIRFLFQAKSISSFIKK